MGYYKFVIYLLFITNKYLFSIGLYIYGREYRNNGFKNHKNI